jgi:tRNA1(Val) A37 N6-methylase TrmN6
MKQHLILETAHLLLAHHLTQDDIVIDATVGNGLDTLFLSPRVSHVYAFDIQKQAIDQTQKLIETHQLSNVTLIIDSHEHYARYVPSFKAAIFNLGYLPGGDKSITTTDETTLRTLKSMLEHLPVRGLIQMVVYTGHPQGKIESEHLSLFLKSLPKEQFIVMNIDLPFQDNQPPYILMIHKKKDGS